MTAVRWAVLVVLAGAAGARADCPNVEIALDGAGFTEAIAGRVRTELAIELARAKQCSEADTFRVALTWHEGAAIAVSASTFRNGTERQFRRLVEPSQIPADGLALTLAAVAAELLTELDRSPSGGVEEAAVSSPSPPHALRWVVSVRLAGELWSHGQTQGGADLALRWVPLDRLGLELSVGGRAALARSFDAGVVHASSALAGFSVLPALVRTDVFWLSIETGVTAGGVWFAATPRDGFAATGQTGWLLSARVGVELALHVSRAVLALRLGLDAPLHGVTATSGGAELTGIAGPGGYLTLGGGLGW